MQPAERCRPHPGASAIGCTPKSYGAKARSAGVEITCPAAAGSRPHPNGRPAGPSRDPSTPLGMTADSPLPLWHAAPVACIWKDPRGTGAPRYEDQFWRHLIAYAPAPSGSIALHFVFFRHSGSFCPSFMCIWNPFSCQNPVKEVGSCWAGVGFRPEYLRLL